jgi:tetratricopeptide (TPR) repeat protein
MVASFLLGTLLLAAQPAPSPSPSPAEIDREARASYEEAKARAGLDPAANVRLALWCESHGLGAERLKHLAQALSSDPANPIARGLLGMVAYRGRWLHPEEVAAGAGSDEALLARLAEYNGRREGMPETADAHWKLGLWCEQQGLAPEAIAHFTAVTRLDPGRADAWSRLGCRKVGGRWLSEAQIAAEQAEAWAQKEADGRWGRRLRQWWKDWLADTGHRPEAEEALAQELEPRAVPTIRTLFDRGTAEQQLVAVRLYDRIDSPEATRELSRFATVDRHPEVRQCAVEALTRRDPKEVIEPLIGLMREQISVQITQGQGPNPVTRLEATEPKELVHYPPRREF